MFPLRLAILATLRESERLCVANRLHDARVFRPRFFVWIRFWMRRCFVSLFAASVLQRILGELSLAMNGVSVFVFRLAAFCTTRCGNSLIEAGAFEDESARHEEAPETILLALGAFFSAEP